MRARLSYAALLLSACLGLAPGSAVAAPPTSVRFTIVNPGGVPQYAYYIVLPSSDGPPAANDWWTAESTTTPGEATIAVAPGQTVYFSRTADVSEKEGTLVSPEGIAGLPYPVTESTPPDVTVTLPSTGAPFRPELSGAEEWLLGQINQRRVALGAPALQVSTTLSAAASEEARDEAVNHRWPDPYFFAVNQDRGWPGDIATYLDYAEADAPFSDPQRVLAHWDGDPSDPESSGIWQALREPSLRYVGIGDGAGAWIVQATDACPDAGDLAACGLTTDTGDAGAWEPTAISIGAPIAGNAYAQGEAVAASFACTRPVPNGVAVASCAGPVGLGQPIDTTTTGAHSFTVTATDIDGDTTSRKVEYQVVQATSPALVEPINTAAPTITGNPVAGAQLTGAPGSWSSGPKHFVYEWLRCPSADNRDRCQTMADDDLPASAGPDRYTVAAADYGNYIVLEVKGVNEAGYNAAFSTPVRVQATPPSLDPGHLPSVAGPSQLHVGDLLTASPGGWSGSQPMLLSYGWLRCPDSVIDRCVGAATTSDTHYRLTPADVGDRMLLVVIAHNASGQSAEAYAPSFTGIVEESAGSLKAAADAAKSASGAIGSVSAGSLLAGKEVEIKLGGPGIIDLLGSSTLISDKGLGLTQQQVAELIAKIEAGLISDKGLGLVGDQLISDKGLGLVARDGGDKGVLLSADAPTGASPAPGGRLAHKGKHVDRPQPLFAGAHKFKRAGIGEVKLRLTKAGRGRIAAYERRAKAARRHGRKPKPLRITLVTVAGPIAGHGDAVFHLRTIRVRP
jgi:hypothetical protein